MFTRRWFPSARRQSAALAFSILALPSIAPAALAQGFGQFNFPPAVATNGELVFSFDEGLEGWKNLDGGNGLSVATGAEVAKEGDGALRYRYPLQQGKFSAAFRGGLSVAGAKSISFWIKTPQPRIFAVALFEEDNSNYLTMFRTGEDVWQQRTYDLDEFRLSNDSQDENGKLDADHIRTVGLMDLEVMQVQAGGNQPSRTVWIDQVAFSAKSTRPAVVDGRVSVDGFEESAAQWGAIRFSERTGMTLDKVSTVEITNEAADVKDGKGALKYEYPSVADGFGVLMGSLSLRMKAPQSVSVWLKTAKPTLVGWVLSEADGSSYSALIPSPGREWQQVQLSLTDFNLDKDSKDENDQLDGDQVNGMGFIDAAALFGITGGDENETRTLWIDGLEASEKKAPARATIRDVDGGKEVVVDDFERSGATWLSLTITGLATGQRDFVQDENTEIRNVDQDPAADKQSMVVDYFAPDGGVVALLRFFGELPLEGATHLKLWVKSKYDAHLMLQLEEDDESGYNTDLKVGGGEKWQRHELKLSAFKLADDKVDENAKLDLDQVRRMLIVDLSGAAGEPGPNTLWLDDVAFFVPGG